MSFWKYILAEQERWSAFLPTTSQKVSETSPPTEYKPDQNYAQGNKCGYGESFQSSNFEYGFGHASQISEEERLKMFLLDYQEILEDSKCIFNNTVSQWTMDNEEPCIPPQETLMEEVLPNDIHLPIQKKYVASTEDSDIHKGESCDLHDQAKDEKLEVNLDYSTQPTDRVNTSFMEPPEISDLIQLISNYPNAPTNDIGKVVEKTAHITAETFQEAEEVVQKFDSLFECKVDENPVVRYEAKVEPVTTLSYSTKGSGETVEMVGKALEYPCEGVFAIECVLDEHPGITSTNEVNIAEPRKILFGKIRMKKFRGWFYDEYDPGDTWIHC